MYLNPTLTGIQCPVTGRLDVFTGRTGSESVAHRATLNYRLCASYYKDSVMAIQINDVLQKGFRRTVSRESLGLIIVFVAFQAVNTAVMQSFNRRLFREFGATTTEGIPTAPFGTPGAGGGLPFAVDLPLAPLAGGLLLTVFVAEAISVLGVRMFARERTVSVSTASLRNGLVIATLNGVVGGTLVTVMTGLGALFLIVPGVFIAVSLFFVRQEIAIENKNFIDALTDSWALTRGVRLKIFGLAALLSIINLLAGSPATVLFFVNPTIAIAVSVILGSVTTVFGLAVTTQAYTQLRGEKESTPPTGPTETAGSDEHPAGV